MSKMDSVSTKRTVTTYESNNYDDYEAKTRPTIQKRNLVIRRDGGGGGGSTMSMQRSTHYSSTGSGPGSLALQATGVTNVKSGRDKEKKDMQDLNERFASYIEKVRFLEAQNKRLGGELDKLKGKWGKETTQIKGLYQAELDEAKRLLEEAQKEKSRLEMRIAALEDQYANMRSKLDEKLDGNRADRDRIEQQNQQLSDIEAELNLLRRRAELLEADRVKAKRTISRLQDALNRVRIDIDNETLLQVDAENRRQALEDELEFLKSIFEQELKELTDLAYRDTTTENREFWKNEMGPALREIQQMYDGKLDNLKDEMETMYNLKIQEFRTGASRQGIDQAHTKEEITRLKSITGDLKGKINELEARNAQIQLEIDMLEREREERRKTLEDENMDLKQQLAKMQAEQAAITEELAKISDSKLTLELEIAGYRKLLEGEENKDGLKQIVDSMYSTMMSSQGEREGRDHGLNVSQSVRGNITAKTTYQRSAKGPVNVGDCDPKGEFITLENTSKKDENVGGWSVKRNIDGREMPGFTLPSDTVIRAGEKVKVYARGKAGSDHRGIESTVEVWDTTGSIINTKFCNPNGEDRANLTQRTVFN